MVSSLLIKSPLVYKYIVSLTKQDCFTMNNKDFTIPKNMLLNWLYSAEMSHWMNWENGLKITQADSINLLKII